MAKEKIIARCAWLTGILLVGATILHGTLGTAEVMTAIKLGDVRPSMADIFRTVWIYSSIMLALSAIWTFFLAGELRQLKRRAWWQGLLIGLGYTGGSAFGMATVGFQPHLLAFMLIGLVLLMPLIIWAGHFKRGGSAAGPAPHIKSTI
jgi:hypothetical protein